MHRQMNKWTGLICALKAGKLTTRPSLPIDGLHFIHQWANYEAEHFIVWIYALFFFIRGNGLRPAEGANKVSDLRRSPYGPTQRHLCRRSRFDYVENLQGILDGFVELAVLARSGTLDLALLEQICQSIAGRGVFQHVHEAWCDRALFIRQPSALPHIETLQGIHVAQGVMAHRTHGSSIVRRPVVQHFRGGAVGNAVAWWNKPRFSIISDALTKVWTPYVSLTTKPLNL